MAHRFPAAGASEAYQSSFKVGVSQSAQIGHGGINLRPNA
jgi:hypothetical protein